MIDEIFTTMIEEIWAKTGIPSTAAEKDEKKDRCVVC
jgi:hypothetical protein